VAHDDQLNDGGLASLGGGASVTPEGAIYCPGCRELVGTGGGNCPHCGTFVPLPTPAKRHQMSVRVPARQDLPAAPSMNPVLLLGGAVATLALIGAVAFSVMDQSRQVEPVPVAAPAATERPSAPTVLPLRKEEVSEVDLAWVDANQRAKAWADTALMFEAEIGPVRKSQLVWTEGAQIRLRYAVPSAAGFTEGTPLGKQGLTVTKTKTETEQKKGPVAGNPRAVTEPLCPFSEVVRLLDKWGAKDDLTTIRYGFSTRFGKAVWTLKNDATPPVERTLDATECALMVR
jgi:hypothetical protein